MSSISCFLQPRVLTNRERKLNQVTLRTKQLIKFSLIKHPPEKLVEGARGTVSQAMKTKKVD